RRSAVTRILMPRPEIINLILIFFFFSSRRRHTRFDCDWSSDVCSSDLTMADLEFLRDRNYPFYLERLYRQEVLLSVYSGRSEERSEERRVGKEWRSRWWGCG